MTPTKEELKSLSKEWLVDRLDRALTLAEELGRAGDAFERKLIAVEKRCLDLATAIDPPTQEKGAARLDWYAEALIEATRLIDVEIDASRANEKKDEVYAERNRLVALIASDWPSCLTPNRDQKERADGWNWIVFVGLPTGQASWHIHDRELPLFEHVPKRHCRWDRHSNSEKYARVERACGANREDAPCCPHPDAYSGGSHYHCPKCRDVVGMMGHHDSSGNKVCDTRKEDNATAAGSCPGCGHEDTYRNGFCTWESTPIALGLGGREDCQCRHAFHAETSQRE